MKHTMRSHSNFLLGFVVSVSILFSGCASTGSSMTDASADPRLTQGDDAEFFSKSGYQACAAAAAIGVIACSLSNSSNKAQRAVIAATAACGAATGPKYYLDQRRTEYADTSERLQVMSLEVQQDTEKVAARTEIMNQVIQDDQQQLAMIKSQIDSKTIDKAKAQKQIAIIDENIAVMRKDLTNMQAKVGEYSKVAAQERSDGAGESVVILEQEISNMNQKVSALQSEVDGLYNQRSAITLG